MSSTLSSLTRFVKQRTSGGEEGLVDVDLSKRTVLRALHYLAKHKIDLTLGHDTHMKAST